MSQTTNSKADTTSLGHLGHFAPYVPFRACAPGNGLTTIGESVLSVLTVLGEAA